MSGYTVCVECFADEFLRTLVRAKGTPSGEDCDFCGAEGQPCIPAEGLVEHFEPVVLRLFKSDRDMEFTQQQGSGEPIGDLLRDSLGALDPDMGDPDDLVKAILGRRWANDNPDDNYPDLDESWFRVEDDWSEAGESYSLALTLLQAEVRQLGHSFHLGPGPRVAIQGSVAAHSHGLIKRALEMTKLVLAPQTKLYRARLDLDAAVRTNVDQFLPPPVKVAKSIARQHSGRTGLVSRSRTRDSAGRDACRTGV